MKLKRHIVGFFSILTFFNTAQAFDIEARGASFPKAVYTEWMKRYEEETGKKISYLPTGSGDGIISAVKRVSDFSGTDKPLRSWRLRRYKLSMFPAIVGSIVLAYNIPGVKDNDLKLDEEAIAAIFSGEAKFWDDPRIIKNNKQLVLPHQPINVVVRSDGSGTTYNFTYYLRKIDYNHFKKADKEFDWQADTIEADGSSGMSKQIKATAYSIGYTDYSYKQTYNLTVATIKNRAGKWVLPSLQSSTNGAKYAKLNKENDFYGIIAYPTGNTSYLIIATSFVLLPDENKDKNKEIVDFFTWAFSNGAYIANKHGFAMLPEETLKDIKVYWDKKGLN